MEENELNEQETENSEESIPKEPSIEKTEEDAELMEQAAAEDLAAFQNAGGENPEDDALEEDDDDEPFVFAASNNGPVVPEIEEQTFTDFGAVKPSDPTRNMERLLDVEMNVTVQFGKTEIPLRDAVNFGVGSMIELNRSVDEPVELLVNNYPFARGEVVVIDGYYGVKITEIGSPEERSQTLLKNSNI